MEQIAIKYISRHLLVPYQNNARTHSAEQVEQIAESIKAFGFVQPILIDSNYQIIAGHGRLLAAELLDREEVPTIQIDHLNEAQVKALVIADNKLALNAGWDMSLLLSEIQEIQDFGIDMDILGFNQSEIESIFAHTPAEASEASERPEQPEEEEEGLTVYLDPADLIIKLGDIIEINDHKILCGDSTDEAELSRLFDGKKAKFALHDPPYGISWKGIEYQGSRIKRPKRPAIAGDEKPFNPEPYMNNADIVAFWGANYFADKLPPSRCWIVWSKKEAANGKIQKDSFAQAELLWVGVDRNTIVIPHFWSGMMRASECDEKGKDRFHPTMKPIFVQGEIIKEFTEAGDLVFDGFLGGGSSLIACDITERVCYAVELSPTYCQLAATRTIKHHKKNNEGRGPVVKINGEITELLDPK